MDSTAQGRFPYKGAVALVYVTMLFEGALNIILVASMTLLSQHYGLNAADISLMVSLRGIGAMVTLYFSGKLSDIVGRRKMIAVGGLLAIVFLVCMPLNKSYALALVLSVVAGVAHGMMDPSGLAVLFDCFDDAGPAMSFILVFFAGGSALTSFLSGMMIQYQISWQYLYWGYAVVGVLQLMFTLAVKLPKVSARTKQQNQPNDARVIQFTHKPTFKREGLLLGGMVLCNAAAVALLYTWVSTYAQEVKGIGEAASVQVLTLYQIGSAMGGAFFAYALRKVHTTVFLALNPAIALVTLFLAIVSPSLLLFRIAFFLLGSTLGIIFLLAINMGGQLFAHSSGAATGALGTVSMLGNTLIVMLSGRMIPITGMQPVFWIALFLLLLSFVTALYLGHIYRKLTVKMR